MKVYKLFRTRDGKLYPLYVEADKEMDIGVWLDANVGQLVDKTHVKAKGCGGKLSLRPGFHSTAIPFTDWIGKRGKDGTLKQRANTVWCECEISGNEVNVTNPHGLRTLPDGWYRYKTNSRQKDPWFISSRLKINRILSHKEVIEICAEYGIVAQGMEA